MLSATSHCLIVRFFDDDGATGCDKVCGWYYNMWEHHLDTETFLHYRQNLNQELNATQLGKYMDTQTNCANKLEVKVEAGCKGNM